MDNLQENIDLIRRHTNYIDDDIIVAKLQELSTPTAVISEYIQQSSISNRYRQEPPTTPLSINQEMYRQMREMLKIVKK